MCRMNAIYDLSKLSLYQLNRASNEFRWNMESMTDKTDIKSKIKSFTLTVRVVVVDVGL